MNQTLLLHRLMQIARLFYVLLIVLAVFFILYFTLPLLYPFLIGLVIAYLINRPVTFLEMKARLPRWLSVLIVLTLFISILITIVSILIAEVVIEISHLIQDIPAYIDMLTDFIQEFLTRDIIINFYDQVNTWFEKVGENYQQKIDENIENGFDKIANAGSTLITNLLTGIKNVLSSLPNLATVMVISVLASFFISKDYYRLREKTKNLIPISFQGHTRQVLDDLKDALFGFIKAQLTLISITAVIVMIGLLILRVDYAITIGLITGLVDLLPYLGTGAVFVPWIIYLFFSGNYPLVIGLSILYAVVVIQRQLMEPKILATNVGLDPLVTLIALFVGLQLFGFLGLIIGPVTIVVFNALNRSGVFRDLWKYIKGKEPVT
ncbi:MAG: sporulation integral membrane protein YtvI [Bacillaceae bacterium]|nr:sporulation integral membrane protein YtvI [Bacillaceae bacterium]